MELQRETLWGFTQEGPETPPAAGACAAVKNAFRLLSDKAWWMDHRKVTFLYM